MGRSLKNISLNGSRNSVALPKGTTAAQPTSAVAGMLRFNTSLNQLEYYNGTIWKQLQGGAGGASTITRDAFTMDGSTLTYGPLSFTPTADQNVLVFIEGVFQHDGKYSISGTNISVATTSVLDAGATLSVIHGFDSI
jgi:hypothetical protein